MCRYHLRKAWKKSVYNYVQRYSHGTSGERQKRARAACDAAEPPEWLTGAPTVANDTDRPLRPEHQADRVTVWDDGSATFSCGQSVNVRVGADMLRHIAWESMATPEMAGDGSP